MKKINTQFIISVKSECIINKYEFQILLKKLVGTHLHNAVVAREGEPDAITIYEVKLIK